MSTANKPNNFGINLLGMTTLQFASQFQKELMPEIISEPLFKKENVSDRELRVLAKQQRVALASQVENAILPVQEAILNGEDNSALVIGEMGVGKTQISISTAALLAEEKGLISVFMAAGSKHIVNMRDEAITILGDKVETYVLSLTPKKNEISVSEFLDLERKPGILTMVFVSKDMIKQSYIVKMNYKWGDICPTCSSEMLPASAFNAAGEKKEDAKIPNQKIKECPFCKERLTYPDVKQKWVGNGIFKNKQKTKSRGMRKIPLDAMFQKELHRRNSKDRKPIDMIIIDEVHDMQTPDSLQGAVYRKLLSLSKKKLIMTGTLSNGLASSIFYILQAAFPKAFMKYGFKFTDVNLFVSRYGKRQHEERTLESGNIRSSKPKELPVIRDGIIPFLAPFTSWIELSDLNTEMPKFSEFSRSAEQSIELSTHIEGFRQSALEIIKSFDPRKSLALGKNLVSLFDNPAFNFRLDLSIDFKYLSDLQLAGNRDAFEGLNALKKALEDEILILVENDYIYAEIDPHTLKGFILYKPLSGDQIFPKEKLLISEVKRELEENRGCLIYSVFNKSMGIANRLEKVLRESFPNNSLQVLPEGVSGADIAVWLKEYGSADIVIASPRKLATGYNLPQFPSIFFYQWSDVRNTDQASRRSWRAVIQKKAVKVGYLAYQGAQSVSLSVLAKRMKAAAKVKGANISTDSIAFEYDETPGDTELFNMLSEKISLDIKPEFSENSIKPGETRPNTILEQRYLDFVTETKVKVKPETKVEVKSETKVEVKPETKVEVKSETKVEVKPETKVEVKPETKVEVKPETKVEVKPETKIKIAKKVIRKNPKLAQTFLCL